MNNHLSYLISSHFNFYFNHVLYSLCFNLSVYSYCVVVNHYYCIFSVKSSGMDGLTCESLKYANHILPVLLSICFTCMFKNCYFPISMLDSVIVSLV